MRLFRGRWQKRKESKRTTKWNWGDENRRWGKERRNFKLTNGNLKTWRKDSRNFWSGPRAVPVDPELPDNPSDREDIINPSNQVPPVEGLVTRGTLDSRNSSILVFLQISQGWWTPKLRWVTFLTINKQTFLGSKQLRSILSKHSTVHSPTHFLYFFYPLQRFAWFSKKTHARWASASPWTKAFWQRQPTASTWRWSVKFLFCF